MDVSIYSVKANSQAGNIKVFLMTTQKGQGPAGDLKVYAFCQKIQQGSSDPGENASRVYICPCEYIRKASSEIHHPLKSWHNFT